MDAGTAMALQFERIEAFYQLPGAARADERVQACLFGVTIDQLRAHRAAMARVVHGSASEMVGDPELRGALERLEAGLVAFVGDSLTSDRQSWAEMISAAASEVRPDVRVVNIGKSGDTTMDLVRRLTMVLGDEMPSLYVVMIGTNDATRTVPFPGGTFVSDAQTQDNLDRLAEIMHDRGGRVIWLTPPPILQDRIASFDVFRQMGITYLFDDIASKAQLVRNRPEQVIDLWAEFDKAGPVGDLVLADGLHVSPVGHALIAGTVLREIAPIETRT